MRRWWQGLGARERLLVIGGGVVVALVALYLLLWEPAALGIRKLTADLPLLQEQNAAMRAMAGEATALRAAAGRAAPIAVAERANAVRRSLERAGLWRPGSAMPADAGQTVRSLTVGGPVATVVSTAATVRSAPPEVGADGERVRVRFDDVDYGVWAGWLAAAETELAARAIRASIVTTAPKSPVGHVRAEVLLDWTPAPSSSAAAPRG